MAYGSISGAVVSILIKARPTEPANRVSDISTVISAMTMSFLSVNLGFLLRLLLDILSLLI